MNRTLEQTVQLYLQRWSSALRPATLQGKRSVLTLFVRFLRDRYPDLSRFDQLQRRPQIEDWLQSQLRLKVGTRQHRFSNLGLFFNDLIDWHWPEAPPPGLLRPEDRPPPELQLPKPFAPELDQAIQQALARSPAWPALGLRLLRQTGLRIGEMLALPLDAFDDQSASLRVPLGKTHAERVIPLDAQTVSLVRNIRAQRGTQAPIPPRHAAYLMVDPRGRHLGAGVYRDTLWQLRAPLRTPERLNLHRLRHTLATELARAGMPVPILMKILGHQTPQMTFRYVEVAQVDVRRAYEQALQHLTIFRAVELPPPLPSASAMPSPIAPSQLLAELITRMEALRRDAPAPAQRARLRQFVKRMRKAQTDLQRFS